MSTEDLVQKYSPYIKVGGENKPNIDGVAHLQRLIQDYILMIQERVDAGEIKPTTCASLIPPVKLFCEMNDILLNWRKLRKLLPRADMNAEDEAYTLQ